MTVDSWQSINRRISQYRGWFRSTISVPAPFMSCTRPPVRIELLQLRW